MLSLIAGLSPNPSIRPEHVKGLDQSSGAVALYSTSAHTSTDPERDIGIPNTNLELQ